MKGVALFQRLLLIGRWGAIGLVAVAWMWGFVWLVWQFPTGDRISNCRFPSHLVPALNAAMEVVGNKVYLLGGMAAGLAGLAMAITMVFPPGDQAFARAMKQRFTDQARPLPARVRTPWVKVLPLTVPILTALVLVTMGTGGGLFLLLMSAAMLLSYRMELAAGLMFGICAWIWPMGGGILLLWLLVIHRQWLASIGLAAAWVGFSGVFSQFAAMAPVLELPSVDGGLATKGKYYFFGNAVVIFAVLDALAIWIVISFLPVAGKSGEGRGSAARWFRARPFNTLPGEHESQGIMRGLGVAVSFAAVLDAHALVLAALAVVAIAVGCREHDISYRRWTIVEYLTYPLAVLGGLGMALIVALGASDTNDVQLKFLVPAWMAIMAVFAALAHRWRPRPVSFASPPAQ